MGMRVDNHALDSLRAAIDSLHCTYIIAYLRGQPDSGCLTQVLYRQLSRPSSSCEGLLRQTSQDGQLVKNISTTLIKAMSTLTLTHHDVTLSLDHLAVMAKHHESHSFPTFI